jgi:predicted transcriptional regulator
MENAMKTVTFSVATREQVNSRVLAAANGIPQGSHISFATLELFSNTLAPKRWEIIQAMTGQDVLSIREVARRVGRDIKAVHGDVTALINAGVIDRQDRGVVFPYDAVHVDFMLVKAA